ncbi:MAG: class II fructose-bisphosphatase [Chloroflexi bacterium]|nr:MAG: class II fructose-bisphosphatase [Chloroflexota bacterium]
MDAIPDRNLAMELARVTEAAAMAAGRWMGRGNKEAADQAAVDAMRLVLNTVEMDGVIVIGEGEKDEAPMLYNGEHLGSGNPPLVDIAVDPIDGTTVLSLGRSGALAVVSLSERGTMYDPQHIMYMDKIAVGPEAAGSIDINAPVDVNLRNIAQAKRRDVDDLTVIILDRPRHQDLIRQVRSVGARIRLISDGDIAGALMTAIPDTGIDVLMGIGGSPEAVVSACALKCVGGDMQCKLWPRSDEERNAALEAGMDFDLILGIDDLVHGNNVFFSATGITDGQLLEGVRYFGGGAKTHTLVMRSRSGTVRFIEGTHRWDKLMRYSQIRFD